MGARTSRRSSRHGLVWLIGLVVLGMLLPAGLLGTATAAPGALDAAVAAAVRDAGHEAPGEILVVPAVERKDWSFGTAALGGTEAADAPPDVVVYVARRDGGQWRAAAEPSAEYRRLLRAAPAGLIPDVFMPADPASGRDVSGQAWNNTGDLPLGMPFAPGSYVQFLGGPHGDNGDANDRPWAAIDLATDGPGTVVAAAPGFATTPCKQGAEDGGPLAMVQHPNGWRTFYFHLTDNRPLNGNVQRGEKLGMTSTESNGGGCFGTASASHVHFSVRRVQGGVESEIDLNNVSIGGWKIQEGGAAYEGCLTKPIIDGEGEGGSATICRNDQFFNNGALGVGADVSVKPSPIVRGEKARVLLKRFPGSQRFDVVFYYRSGIYQLPYKRKLGTLSSGSGNKDISYGFTFPKSISAASGVVCIENQTLGKLACTARVPVKRS